MREDWAEKLRRKLEGHRKTPPPGLWEGICKEMGFEAEPVSKSAVIRRLYWAAAAAVLALVGFFVVYNSNDIEQPQLANAVSQQPVSEKLTSEKQISEQPISEQPVSEQPVSEQPVSEQLVSKKPTSEEPTSVVPTSETPASEQPASDQPADESEQATSAEEKDEPIEKVLTEHQELRAENADTHTSSELNSMQGNHNYPLSTIHSHPNKWSMGVYASGGLLAANTSQRTDRLYINHYSAMNNGEIGYQGPYTDKVEEGNFTSLIPAYTMAEFRSEHHLPIRFGVNLNYQLTPHIALQSGIGYTYLYSEFSIPLYEEANYDQKLHYLGIPLGVSWQLWSTDHFQFYVSGGAMLEKCVSAEVDGSTINKKPWQWSVNAAAGAEYSFIPQLGFYLEPSLGYYFDDGTALEHYYKKHPVTPTIEFGLRLHLNK